MANLLANFTGANGTLLTAYTDESGGSWSDVAGYTHTGVSSLDGSGRVAQTGGTNGQNAVYRSSVVPAAGSYDFSYTPNGDAAFFGPCFDMAAGTTAHYHLCRDVSNKLSLYRYPAGGGAPTLLASSTPTLPSAASAYGVVCTVRRSGGAMTITADIGGTSYINFTDAAGSALAAGGLGIHWSNVSAGKMDQMSSTDIGLSVSAAISASDSAISLTATAVAGTAPYTYQWHRSTTHGFTPSGGTAISGATASTLTDSTVSYGQPYYYRVVVDSASATATSAQAQGALRSAPIKVVAAGDSITAGSYAGVTDANSPSAAMAALLTEAFNFTVLSRSNQGVSGSKSTDWGTGTTNLTNLVAAVAAARSGFSGPIYVPIMLGTNDSGAASPTSVGNYTTAMTQLVNSVVAAGATPILNDPPFPVPGSISNAYDAQSPARILSYLPVLDSLANGTTILRGDKTEFFETVNSPYSLTDGIHPNAAQSNALGRKQGMALVRAITAPNPATVQSGQPNGNGLSGTYSGSSLSVIY